MVILLPWVMESQILLQRNPESERLRHALGKRDRERPAPDPAEEARLGLGDNPQMPYEVDSIDRRIVSQVVQRPFRDRAFSVAIKAAYQDTCAVTGLKLINGGGRSEVQAAHIRPVADRGPDSVRNGLALSGTVHWMFDRGLISVDDDYSMLIANGGVPETISRLMNPERRLLVPSRPDERPHSQFLQYHREKVFKG
jgi:putative restriction endonuclease